MTQKLVVLSLVCLSSAFGGTRHQLKYQTETDGYDIDFDDARISLAAMKEIVWLSPYIPPDLPAPLPFMMTFGSTKEHPVDKTFTAPWLEYCATVPVPCTRDALVPDGAFMKNAERILERGAAQVEALKKKKLPAVLEPVRAYLLLHLTNSLEKEQVRYRFLETHDIEPMRALVCRECLCGEAESILLKAMKGTEDGAKRLALSHKWNQKVIECERRHYPPAYPLHAWERFIADFGIIEHRSFKGVD